MSGAVRVADAPTYDVDRVDEWGLLPDMYASTKEEYMGIQHNNLQGDNTPLQKLGRHKVFAVITAWSAWQENAQSKRGMSKATQQAGFFAEYCKTLAVWARHCQKVVRRRIDTDPAAKMPWLLSPAPETSFKEGEYAQLASQNYNGAEKGEAVRNFPVLLFPLAHAHSGKSPFAVASPQWSRATVARGSNLKSKVDKLARVMKQGAAMLFSDRESPAVGMEGQKKSGKALQDCIDWLHSELPKRTQRVVVAVLALGRWIAVLRGQGCEFPRPLSSRAHERYVSTEQAGGTQKEEQEGTPAHRA